MKNKLAQIISLVLHPLLMPSYFFFFIIVFASGLMQPIQKEALFRILAVIFIVSFIIPTISLVSLRLSNFISDLNLEDRRQRIVPFVFIMAFYGITAYMFYSKLHAGNLIFLVFAIATGLILVLTSITLAWKISLHGAGIGSFLGLVLALNMIYPVPHFSWVLAVIIVLSGIIAYARLALDTHTPLQVYAGILIGTVFCFGCFYFFI